MERLIDGRGYRRVFERETVRARVGILTQAQGQDEDATFVTAIGDAALDVNEYSGAPVSEAIAAVGGRSVFTFTIEDVDSFREEGLLANQLHQETALWRSKLPDSAQIPPHFLIDLFEGRLAKFLPSAFGVLLVFAGEASEGEAEDLDLPRNFFLGFRRGKLESFYEPELESLATLKDAQNRVSVASAAKQLATKHALTVQAMVVCPREWREWQGLEPKQARKLLAASLRAGRTQLVPFKLLLSSAIFLKGL